MNGIGGLQFKTTGLVLDMAHQSPLGTIPLVGSDYKDFSPYKNHGTPTGVSETILASGLAVMDFDGVNNVVTSTKNSTLTGNPDFSILAWLYIPDPITQVNTYPTAVFWGAATAMNSVFFGVRSSDPTTFYVGFHSGGGYASNVPVNQWAHFAYLRTGGGNAFTGNVLRINGTSYALTNDLPGGTPNISAGVYQLGGEINEGRYANYRISSLRNYNRTLSTAHSDDHYTAEKWWFGL